MAIFDNFRHSSLPESSEIEVRRENISQLGCFFRPESRRWPIPDDVQQLDGFYIEARDAHFLVDIVNLREHLIHALEIFFYSYEKKRSTQRMSIRSLPSSVLCD